MGKKRAVSIRRIADTLIKLYPNSFTSDFEENKRIISGMTQFPSRASRNKVAGYITRINESSDSETIQDIKSEESSEEI